MVDADATESSSSETKNLTEQETGCLVFISHDSRDAELAKEFSKLLKSVSAGMLKSFRSSDREGTEGIQYGDEWYKRLMSRLKSASDVVCLFTERSLDRPWILYEAGVAKGTLDTAVHGVALGVPLGQVSTGPFYQFQNCDDSEEGLTKLVMQLLQRIPGSEPDPEAVRVQVQSFKARAQQLLASLSGSKQKKEKKPVDDSSAAKLFEEVKVMLRDLPSRFEVLTHEGPGAAPRRMRLLNVEILKEISPLVERYGSRPVGILLLCAIVRDDVPWLYELGMEVYRAARSGNIRSIEARWEELRQVAGLVLHGQFLHEFGIDSRYAAIATPRYLAMLEDVIASNLERYRQGAAQTEESGEALPRRTQPSASNDQV